jgi:hypothetical protein
MRPAASKSRAESAWLSVSETTTISKTRKTLEVRVII